MEQRQQRLNAIERQLAQLERHIRTMSQASERLMRWRVLSFIGAVVSGLAGLALGSNMPPGNWLGLFMFTVALMPFLYLVNRHRQLDAMMDRFERMHSIKAQHRARMQLNWSQLPQSTTAAPHDHPFAFDLDLVGERGLLRLLDTSVTLGGSELLSKWLLALHPELELIQQNQNRIEELIRLAHFRDKLHLQGIRRGARVRRKWDDRSLLQWLTADERMVVPGSHLSMLSLLATFTVVLFLGNQLGYLRPFWILTWVSYLLLSAVNWQRIAGLFDEALEVRERLRSLEAVISYLEDYQFAFQPHLRELVAPLHAADRPSILIRNLNWIMAGASLQGNPLLWMAVNMIIPWDFFVSAALVRVRRALREILPTWLAVWYELEALSSLATFADHNPGFSFPDVDTKTVLNVRELGHPMITAEKRVTNDFNLDKLGIAVIITGSNMAGKSSFLRAVGVNLQLAYSGSVVCATAMQAGLFRTFTSIRVSDSVVDGFSYFYAEVHRLKSLLMALNADEPLPLFYLIDEIYRGTNNRERRIGSRAYVQALVGGHGVGLIATHDLELVKLADELHPVQNYHFREEVIDGKMEFDYRLRPGPSPTTNALKIMALAGLPVGPQSVDANELSDGSGSL